MTRVVLVRHGETVWHAENRYAGISDVELTPRGHEQARLLAKWAAEAGLDAVWSSPLTRARLTAEACAGVVGTEVRVDARLSELDFGAADGLTRDEMRTRFPAAVDAFQADPVAHHLPGGEDPAAAARRFTDCLADVSRRWPDGRVLVVAHTTAIRLALCQLLGVPLRRYRRLFPNVLNCALTELRLLDDDVAVLQFNTPMEAP
jgi:probable phosphoglycerate mutase